MRFLEVFLRRIDAHHHLWRYSEQEYGWIGDHMLALRRDFSVSDLEAAMQPCRVDGAIAVQARQTLEETDWLLELANAHACLLGVVGWLPIADSDFTSTLERAMLSRKLKGLRHVVQGEPDGFLDRVPFNRGIQALQRTGLVYDLLIQPRQLQEATRFVDRHPYQSFVLDHAAKPDIRNHEMTPWDKEIKELARRPNVCCKVSGMVTEAEFSAWSPGQLRPYYDVLLQAFGPLRLMIGSDWPVLTVACTYSRWWQTVETWISELYEQERAAILGGTAERIYRLADG